MPLVIQIALSLGLLGIVLIFIGKPIGYFIAGFSLFGFFIGKQLQKEKNQGKSFITKDTGPKINIVEKTERDLQREQLAEKLNKKRGEIKKKQYLQEKKENINKPSLKLIFDVETNGLHFCSVLSFSALVLDKNNNIIDVVDRYYYKEPYEKNDTKALSINGLHENVIRTKRKDVTYSKYFREDKEIRSLFDSCDTLIAHNIDFDLKHIKNNFNINTHRKKTYCTMLETMYLYDAPYQVNGHPKYPKLSESVEHFKIDIKAIKKTTGAKYHDSLFDCYCVYEIYKKLR